ncbi:MAG TPA: EAL domain-containing protein [Humisphaera sp.]
MSASPIPDLLAQVAPGPAATGVAGTDWCRRALDAHAIVAVTDAAGVIVEVNDHFCRVSGYAREELVGRTHKVVNSGHHPRSYWTDMWRTVAGGRTWRGTVCNRAKGGRLYWVDTTIVPMPGPDGRPAGYVAIRAEVTDRVLAEQALGGAQAQLQAVLDSATGVSVVAATPDGTITLFNRGAERLLGYAAAEMVGRCTPAVFHDPAEVDRRAAELTAELGRPVAGFAAFVAVAERDGAERRTWTYVRKDGGRRTVDLTVTCVRDAGGVLVGFLGTATDVTEQHALADALVDTQEQYRSTFHALAAGVVMHDPAGRIVQWNPAAEQLLGLTADELTDVTPVDPRWRVVREDGSPLPGDEHPAAVTLRTGRPQRDVLLGVHRPDGTLAWLLVNSEPVMQYGARADRAAVVATFVDVTERRRMEDELRRAATTDRLTGLANRALLSDRLRRAALRAARAPGYRYAVLFLDFDRFKLVNDTLGHEAGDDLLRQIAARLRAALREGDTVGGPAAGDDDGGATGQAARLGGDEFVVLLDGLRAPADATLVADRLLAALAAPYRIGPHEVYSTASIGVVAPDPAPGAPAPTAEDLLQDADAAMYAAKLAGKARWALFDPAMRRRASDRAALEADLRRAAGAGQLRLAYQPVVSLETGRVASFEALLRWRHPDRGDVPPAEFIPLAEDAGLIVPVGEWALREACRQLAAWRAAGAAAGVRVAVNLSRAQLLVAGLPGLVRSVLAEHGLAAADLTLEVTESAVMRDPEAAARTLAGLRAVGVSLAMDDFGTGHSSLACLHQFPFDVLKVDRAFVAKLTDGRGFAALVQSVTLLARNLGMDVVAEGVETPEQVAALQALDCRYAQGYHFARPLPPDEAARYVGVAAAAAA